VLRQRETRRGLDRLQQALLHRLRQYKQIDWSRASIGGVRVSSPRGARTSAPTQPTGASSAADAIILTDARGLLLAILVSEPNRHDSMLFEDLLDAVSLIGGLQGRPGKRADKGYAYAKCRKASRDRGIQSRIEDAALRAANAGAPALSGRAHTRLVCEIR
jgi:hypothetical protein